MPQLSKDFPVLTPAEAAALARKIWWSTRLTIFCWCALFLVFWLPPSIVSRVFLQAALVTLGVSFWALKARFRRLEVTPPPPPGEPFKGDPGREFIWVVRRTTAILGGLALWLFLGIEGLLVFSLPYVFPWTARAYKRAVAEGRRRDEVLYGLLPTVWILTVILVGPVLTGQMPGLGPILPRCL